MLEQTTSPQAYKESGAQPTRLARPMWPVELVVVPLITALAIVAGIMVASKLFGPLPLAINQTVAQRPNTFNVTGTSEIQAEPDQVEVSLGVTASKPTVEAAQEEVNQVSAAIIEQLTTTLGVDKEDMKTENYSVNPEYDYQSSTQRITGYQVNTSVRVKLTDFSKLNQAIDLATANGANQVNGVQFTLSEEKEEESKKEGRKEAIADARENAQELAAISGLRLGNIVDVQEYMDTPYAPMYREMSAVANPMMGGDMAQSKTDIQPGTTTYTYNVTLSYQTL